LVKGEIMGFEKYLEKNHAAEIIRARIVKMAEDGFQHQLNLEFIQNEIDLEHTSDEERSALELQKADIEVQSANLHHAIRWHNRRLSQLDLDVAQ